MGKVKRIWRESQHPRDARGRFARRGSPAWVKRAGEELRALAGESGDVTRVGSRPRISRNAKAGAVLQAHADGGRPSAVRAPKATITQRPSPANLADFNAQATRAVSAPSVRPHPAQPALPDPSMRETPQERDQRMARNLDRVARSSGGQYGRFMSAEARGVAPTPDAPAAPKKRTPRPAPGAAALIAARAAEQAPQMPAMVAARTAPDTAPVPGAENYAAMRRHTLVALARDAKINIRGKSNTEIANDLAAHDAKVKADRAAKLNPSGVGTPSAPAAPTSDREKKIAAKRAELEAARQQYQRLADWRPYGSAKRKSFGVRVDANLRRTAQTHRDIERLERELAALERPEPPKSTAGPVNLDDIKVGSIIKRDGSLYRVTKVNAKSVKVEMPPGWDDTFKKDHKITEVHQPKPKAEVDTPRDDSKNGGMTSTPPEAPTPAPKAAPGADTEHLKRPKAKKGDLVVIERKTSSYTIGKGREEGTDVEVGIVTSTDRDGRVTSYSTNADGSYPRKVDPAREKTYKLEQERVDVQAAMATAAANLWPSGRTGRPYASLDEARAAVAPHLGDQTAKLKAARTDARGAAKRRPASEAKVTEAAKAMREEKDYAKALRLIDEGEAADPDYKDKQGRGWGDFRKFVTGRRDQATKEQAEKDAEVAKPKESEADLAIGRALFARFSDPNRAPFDYAPSNAVRATAEQAARDEVDSLLPSGAVMFDRTTLRNRLASASGAVAAFTHQREAKRAEIAQARELIAKIENPEYRELYTKEVLRKLEREEETLIMAISRQEADRDRARADLEKMLGRGADREKLIARRRSDAESRARGIANDGGRSYGDTGAGAKIIAKFGTRPSSADLKAMSQRDRDAAQDELIMRGSHQDDLSKIVRSAVRNVDTQALTPEQRQAWIDATDAPTRALVHTLAARQRRDLALSRLAALEAHEDRPSDAPELRSELDKAIAQERANLDSAQSELATLEPQYQANLDRVQAAVNAVRATAGLKPAKLNTKALDTAYAKRIESAGITPQPNPPAPPAPNTRTKVVFKPRKQIPADTKRAVLARDAGAVLARDGRPIETPARKATPAPAPASTSPRYQAFSERMAGNMSQAEILAAQLRTEEERQRLRARETERARQVAEERANDTRSEREKLEEQLQQERMVRDIGYRSGRSDPKREARIRAAENRLEEIRVEERKAQIKDIKKGDRVTTTYRDGTVEVEVVGKTKDGYLRVLLPNGKRGSLDPKGIEGVTPAPKADAAPVAAPEMPIADVDNLMRSKGLDPSEFTPEQRRDWLRRYETAFGPVKAPVNNDASKTVADLKAKIRSIELERESATLYGDSPSGDEDEQDRAKKAQQKELSDLRARLVEAERAERGYDQTTSKAFAGLSDAALDREIKNTRPGTKKLEALVSERDARAAARFKAARPKADAAPAAAPIRARISPDAKRAAVDKANADATAAAAKRELRAKAEQVRLMSLPRDEKQGMIDAHPGEGERFARGEVPAQGEVVHTRRGPAIVISQPTSSDPDRMAVYLTQPGDGLAFQARVRDLRRSLTRAETEKAAAAKAAADAAREAERVKQLDASTPEMFNRSRTLARDPQTVAALDAMEAAGFRQVAQRTEMRGRAYAQEAVMRDAAGNEIAISFQRDRVDKLGFVDADGQPLTPAAVRRLANLEAERRGEPETASTTSAPRDIGGIEELRSFRIDRPQDGYDAHGTPVRPGDTVTIATDRHNRTDEKVRVLKVGIGRTGGSALATVQYANGDREQILLGNLVRTDTAEGHYLDNLAADLTGDERAGQSLRGQPSALDLIRSIRGKSFNYQAAALQKEARKHAGKPLGERLTRAADDLVLLGRGTAGDDVVGRSLRRVDTSRVNSQNGGMTNDSAAQARRNAVIEHGTRFTGNPYSYLPKFEALTDEDFAALTDEQRDNVRFVVSKLAKRAEGEVSRSAQAMEKRFGKWGASNTPTTEATMPRITPQVAATAPKPSTPQLGVTESSRGRTTTITLPDGTTAQRTSKTMAYTHAVVATTDHRGQARDLRADNVRRQKFIDALQAWIDRGADTSELVAHPTANLSVAEQRRGKSRNEYYLPGFEPVRVAAPRVRSRFGGGGGGGTRLEDVGDYSLPNFNDTEVFNYKYDTRDNGKTAWEVYGPEYVLDSHRGTIKRQEEKAAELDAGPEESHAVYRWSQSLENAWKGRAEFEQVPNTRLQVVGVGGEARELPKSTKRVPTAEEKAAALEAKKATEKADAAARRQEFFDKKIQGITEALNAPGNEGRDNPEWHINGITEQALVSLAKYLKVKVPNREQGPYGPKSRTREQVDAIRQSIIDAIRARSAEVPAATTPEPTATVWVDERGRVVPNPSQVEIVRGQVTRRPAPTPAGTGPGNVAVGGTDADRAAARPRLEINGRTESDRAYAVRTAPSREAALRMLDGYGLAGLRAIARDEGIVPSGTKPVLLARLMQVLYDRHADAAAIERMVNRSS